MWLRTGISELYNRERRLLAHPFQECFWKDRLVNLNGRSYKWNIEINEWEEQQATTHLASIKLIEKFEDLSDNEFQYVTKHHVSDNSHEFEQMNVLNELVTRIQAEDAGSMSALMVSKVEDSKFGITAGWTEKLKIAFKWIAGITTLLAVSVILIAICGPSSRSADKTKEFTLRLQAWRLRQQLLCQRMTNRINTENATGDIELDAGNTQGEERA